jgi:hypothetical protein
MSTFLNQHNSIRSNSVNLQEALSAFSSAIPIYPRHVEEVKLFLDMDGVLTDFMGACEKLGEHMALWYDSDKEHFWKCVTSAGPEFWSEMSWMAGGRELHRFLIDSGFFPTILSALPNPDRKRALVNARTGKIRWLRKELGVQYASNAILCFRPEKALQSGASRVLIDDNPENILEWEEAGGRGILHKNTNRTIRCLNRIIETEHHL